MTLASRFRDLYATGELDLPLPGRGQTAERHRYLFELGRRDLALARLVEAHTDAVAILAEAGRLPIAGALYGVWAAESARHPLQLARTGRGFELTGTKMFCSGAGLVDRALVAAGAPEQRLIDVDLRANREAVEFDGSGWITSAFAATETATASFRQAYVADAEVIDTAGWYLSRPGFWHGACGPAACWAGGAMGLVDYAFTQPKTDPHTMAHLGAMAAEGWAMQSYLNSAGLEIDSDASDYEAAVTRALQVRHLIEQGCSEILRRFGRAFGPRPLAFDVEASRRYQEVELYIRQCHAEHDLENLGRKLHVRAAHRPLDAETRL